MKFLSFLIRRAVYGAVMLLVLITMVFFMLHLAPGDIVDTLAGEMGGISPEVKAELRHHYGLDKPVMVQLFIYLNKVTQGDLGYSFYMKQPVAKVILDRFPATGLLFILALICSTVLGTFLGNLASLKPDGFFSAAVTTLALAGYSAPAFWIGIMLLLAFSVTIPLFPVAGMMSIKTLTEGGSALAVSLDVARHLVLPLVTLSVIYLADFSRLARASMMVARMANIDRTRVTMTNRIYSHL